MPRTVFLLLMFIPPLFASQRIATLSPALTELVFQIGKQKNLVAVSQGSEFPPEAKMLPRLGAALQPSLEALLSYNPSIVLADDQTRTVVAAPWIAALGAKLYPLGIRSVSDLFVKTRALVKDLFGENENTLIDGFEKKWIGRKKCPSEKALRFLALVWVGPVIAYSKHTMLSDILEQIGGVNVVPSEWQAPFPQLSEDWLIQQTPDVLFFVSELEMDIAPYLKRWWPKHTPKLVFLSAAKFSRATFTPLLHLGDTGFLNE